MQRKCRTLLFSSVPCSFLRVFPFSICILHHSCTLELINWRLPSLKGNLLRSKGHKNDPSAKIQCCAMSLFLCPSLQYLHSSSLFFLQILFGFLPELYVESLFVFHIGLIQWSVCMFVRSVMWMHDSNLTLCGRLCHTKSIFKYNQKGNIVYGLSSHLFKPFWTLKFCTCREG